MIALVDDDAELLRLADVRRKAQSRRPALSQSRHLVDVPDSDTSDIRRYKLGIANVDRMLGPLRPGGFTLVCAVSGVGKTIVGEQIAVANSDEYRVLVATLEMTEEDIRDSILAREMGLSLEDAEKEKRDKSDRYKRAISVLGAKHLHLWRPEPRKPRTPDAILSEAGRTNADILVVDYTRHIGGWESGNKASAIVEYFSNAVKETKLHLVMLAQLKLENSSKRPTPADVEDTKRLYQEADKVLFLYRPFFGDSSRDTISEVISPKNRRGRVFKSHVHWGGPLRSFYAMDDVEESTVPCCNKRPRRHPSDASLPYKDSPSADAVAGEIEPYLFPEEEP